MRYGRGLGESVPFHEQSLGQLLKRFLHFHGQGRRPADTSLDGLDTILAHATEIIDRHVHARRTGEDGWLVFLDGFQHIQNNELRFQDQRRTHRDGHVQGRGHSITMEERHNTQEPFLTFFRIRQPVTGLQRVRHKVAV